MTITEATQEEEDAFNDWYNEFISHIQKKYIDGGTREVGLDTFLNNYDDPETAATEYVIECKAIERRKRSERNARSEMKRSE